MWTWTACIKSVLNRTRNFYRRPRQLTTSDSVRQNYLINTMVLSPKCGDRKWQIPRILGYLVNLPFNVLSFRSNSVDQIPECFHTLTWNGSQGWHHSTRRAERDVIPKISGWFCRWTIDTSVMLSLLRMELKMPLWAVKFTKAAVFHDNTNLGITVNMLKIAIKNWRLTRTLCEFFCKYSILYLISVRKVTGCISFGDGRSVASLRNYAASNRNYPGTSFGCSRQMHTLK